MEIAIIVAIAVVAIGVVILPLVRKSNAPSSVGLTDDAIDTQVARYRTAIAKGTLCEHCLNANPEGARYCGDCGRAL